MDKEDQRLADHGGEAVGGFTSTVTAAQTLTLTGKATHVDLSDSLFGSWLLTLAYQRDPEIRHLLKRSGIVDKLTLLSVAGVSGLGLAQSVYAYRHLDPQTIPVTEAHTLDGHDHMHLPGESRVPSTLGIIGSGVTLAALGVRTVSGGYLSRKLKARQTEIKSAIEEILALLETDASPTEIQPKLAEWVGDRASREFLLLWQAVYP